MLFEHIEFSGAQKPPENSDRIVFKGGYLIGYLECPAGALSLSDCTYDDTEWSLAMWCESSDYAAIIACTSKIKAAEIK